MKKKQKNIFIFLFIFFLGSIFLISYNALFAASEAVINATIKISVCGNNIKEDGEQCDVNDFGGATCQSLGYAHGTLFCKPSCEFNISNCTSGGGGGGVGSVSSSPTAVNFSGRAYPASTVSILEDGQLAKTVMAGSDANFNASLSGLTSGNYTFAVYSEDNQGRRSSLDTFPVILTKGETTTVSNIFISPTIAVDKSEVVKGDNLVIFGQSAPGSDITISINSQQEIFVNAKADDTGAYLYNLNTNSLDLGQYITKSKAGLNGELSPFSEAVSFTVGAESILNQSEGCSLKGDLNNDCHVNLVDFSIMAYWYNKANPPANIDLNNDGQIDLFDFSITAFYWTG